MEERKAEARSEAVVQSIKEKELLARADQAVANAEIARKRCNRCRSKYYDAT